MFFMPQPLSLEQERNKINQAYSHAKDSFIAYKRTMAEIYHPSLEAFAETLETLHTEAKVSTASLIKAFEQTEGFLKGTVTPDAYARIIKNMKAGQASSLEPSRLSQAMETLSWAVWVISILCVLSGALLLGVIGMFASVAIDRDAKHSDVKYPEAHNKQASQELACHMEKIENLMYFPVPVMGVS